jgi:hypothetical protein
MFEIYHNYIKVASVETGGESHCYCIDACLSSDGYNYFEVFDKNGFRFSSYDANDVKLSKERLGRLR